MKEHKTLVKYIVSMIFVMVIMLLSNKVHAAGLSIKASKSTINEGDSVTITVSSTYTGRVNITASGGSLSNSKVWLENNAQSVTLKADAKDKITVTASPSGQMSDSNGGKVDVQSVSTTISIKSNNSSGNTNKVDDNEPEKPTFKSTEETVYATGNANIRKSYSADSEKIGGVEKGESLTRTGIGDNGWSKVTYNGGTGYIKSSLLTNEEPKKSEDKTLKELSIEGYEMDPAFDPEITDYSVSVGEDVEKLDIKVTANDEKAKFEIVGNEALQVGDNIIKITVTAEDQTTRLYTINVAKQAKEVLSLSSLKVDGYTLTPKFSPDVLEYKLTIQDSNVNSINIVALPNIENAKVEVVGNTDLKQGENVIQIKVASEDDQETITYKIIANRINVSVANTNQSNWILYAGIIAIVVLVLLIVIVVVKAKRRVKSEDKGDSDNQDYSDLYGFSSKDEQSDYNSQKDDGGIRREKKDLEDGLFGKLTDVGINDNTSQDTDGKYEDGFNYNPHNTSDIGDNNKEYSTVSSENSNVPDSNTLTQYNNEWNHDDDYRGRRTKGKHSK